MKQKLQYKQIKWKQAFAVSIAAALMLAGCGSGEKGGAESKADLSSYPVDTDTELTYWCDLSANAAASVANLGDTPFAQELSKRTGVKVKYIHPAQGQAKESFSLMVASNDLPDIVFYKWLTALGSPTIAIEDQVIQPLNGLMDQYAVNMKDFVQGSPEVDKMVKTDNGQYYVFPFIRNDDMLRISQGIVLRNDWLKDLKLEVPKTYQELETVLRAFKEQKGAAAPLSFVNYNLARVIEFFSASNTFYVDNGRIQYGPCQPEFKEAVSTLNRWFQEGLLDRNYVSVDTKLLDANMTGSKTGATIASGGSGVGKWLDTMQAKDPKFDLAGIPYLIDEKTGSPKFIPSENLYNGNGAAITAACKEPELAAKFLDYAYTEDGGYLYNFGIEGESYTMADGYPTYTDTIMKNGDGLTVSQAMARYILACGSGPFIQEKRYIEQYYARPQQKAALDAWTVGLDEADRYKLPPVTFTAEESEEYSNIMAEVEKYRDEMVATYISGIRDLGTYDEFLQTMRSLGIDRAVELTQTALERYEKR